MAKVIQFFKESRAELKKVVWPTKDDVISSIKVVIVSTIVVALILGLLDLGFSELFRIIMKQDRKKMSKNWYILHTYTGYEGKIERTIRSLLEKNEIDPEVILDVKVPVEELVEIKDGKKRTRSNKFLPGYIMLEMDLPEIGWKDTCAKLYKIQGVTGFVGNVSRSNRPMPITKDEAMNLLQKSGVIKGDKQVRVRQSFNVGDVVKIADGPFASFTGTVKEINLEKEKLSVEVQIFGRPTPVEVSFLQAEKA